MSESSYGGSQVGSQAELQIPTKDKLHLGDEDDDEELDEQSQSLTAGIFGVIYTVSRERTVTWRFVAFKVFFDAWQLLMLILNPAYGWRIDGEAGWWKVVSVIQLTDFMRARGLTFFLVCLYIFVVLLLITVCMCLWVAWSFKSKRFDQVWPITFLRWFGVIFFQMLDIASMTFFLITLDCQYFDVPAEARFHNQEFPQQYCWGMPYLIHCVVSAVSLLVFVLLTTLFQMGEMELNMATKNPLAMAHSKVEVQSFLLKFLMACASTFLNNLKWMSAFYVACTLLLVYISIQWVPYYHAYMNHMRAAVNTGALYSAAVMMLLVYRPGVDGTDPSAVQSWQSGCTIAFLAGVVPAGLLGALASYLRVRYALQTVVQKFRSAAPGTKPHFIHEFTHPLEVEISARCCRKWADKDTLDEEAVSMAGVILKAGKQQLPSSAYMTILYASYLIDVQGSYQSGLLELKAGKKADPSFLERFAIFSREQQNTQRASGAKGAHGADLVSYVEQQRDYRLALRVHKEALKATSVFWKSLVHAVVKLETLAKAVKAFDESVKQADRTYRDVIQRNSENWRLIRMYAAFVENIKNDPWSAAKWRAEADRLFQAEDDERHNAVLLDAMNDDDEGAGPNSKALRAAMEDANRGVVIINAECVITTVSKTASDMLGYMKKQLVGKNVNVLIPQPFAKSHDQYVANYIKTGNSNILNKPSRLMLVHYDGHIVPVVMYIVRLSGIGMDSVFVSIFETSQENATIWLLSNGGVISVDSTFTDWFGHQATDLTNTTYLTSLVADPKALMQTLKLAHTSDKVQEHEEVALADIPAERSLVALARCNSVCSSADGDIMMQGVQIKHKFASSITCSLSISNGGGSGQRHFFVVHVQRPMILRSMVVTDRKGKLIHVSRELADMLGYPVATLLGDMSNTAWDALLPEPFSQLHRGFITQDLAMSNLRQPLFSCRAGLSMCLLTNPALGSEVLPFKLAVEPRRLEGGEPCNLAYLDNSTMDEALNERRLSVILDESGIIISVSDSPESLFGFAPERMLGRSIAEFVDVFQPDGNSLMEELQADLGNSDIVQETLVELAVRSLSSPNTSYRVGITAPAEVQVTKVTGAGRRRSALGDAIAAHITSECMHPAVMQVKVHMGRGIDRKLSVDRKAARVRTMASRPSMDAAGSTSHGPMSEGKDGMAPPDSNLGSRAGAGLKLELDIWRVDRLTGVLQIDRSGRVTGVSPIPLFNPGPLLGSDSLVGMDIGEILPPMRSRPLSDLFLPDLGANIGQSTKKKGALKTEKKNPPVRERRPGPVSIVETTHLTDRLSLALSAQAVWGWGPKKEIHVILHVHNPCTGIANFRDWLKANPAASKGLSRKASQDHLVKTPVSRKASSLHIKEAAQLPSGPITPARSAAALLGAEARLGMSTPTVTPVKQIGSRKFSPSNQLPSEEAKAPALLLDTDDLDLHALADDKGQEDDIVAGDPMLDTPDLAYAELDKALGELQRAATAAVDQDRPKHGTVQHNVSIGKSVAFSQAKEDKEPVPEVVATVVAVAPQGADRVRTWVLTGGSVSGGALPKMDSAMTLSSKQSLSVQRQASLSSDGSNSPGSGTDQPATERRSIAFSAADKMPARRTDDEGGEDAYGGDMLVKDALDALGGNRPPAALEDSSGGGSQGQGSVHASDQGDYRRGKRFRRITRMLTGEAAKRNLTRFKMQAYGAAAFVIIVTVACFATMFVLLRVQETGVLVLNTVGRTGVEIGQIYMSLVTCDMIVMNQFVSGLTGLQSSEDVEKSCLQPLQKHGEVFMSLHQESFYTVMSKPNRFGLHDIWNKPTLNCTLFEDGTEPMEVFATPANRSLWDVGNMYGVHAQQMAQNLLSHNESVSYWRQWSHPMFLGGNSDVMFNGVYQTLDGLVQIVINQSDEVNRVQYILMAVEGCVCSVLVIAFMFSVTDKMTQQRYNLYNVFMVIPVTLLKGLAKKTATFEDLMLEDTDAPPGTRQDGDDQQAQAGNGEHGMVKLNMAGAASSRKDSMSGTLMSWVSALAFWRTRASVSPIYTKRKLTRSHTAALWLSLPFLCWGAMMVGINVAGHAKLGEVSGPIAIFNLVNFVTIQSYRAMSMIEDMIQFGDAEQVTILRDRLKEGYTLPLDYAAMLFGHSAVPDQTSSHFTLATTGVAFAGASGVNILYNSRECLREDPSACLPSTHPLHPLTHSGLDAIIQTFMRTLDTVMSLNTSVLVTETQTIPQFATIWNLKEDIEGGLNRLNQDFYDYVVSLYERVIMIHIVGLVLSVLLMLVFVVLMLRPYTKQLTNEARRIAELLSQLPADVDVEGLVKRAQIASAVEVSKDDPTASMRSDNSMNASDKF